MPLIEIDDLSFQYPDGTPALRNVSLSIDEGECVGLAGPNGAGKSTLLLHLNGLLPARARGEGHYHELPSVYGKRVVFHPTVRVSGMKVTDENLPAIRRTVGLVFQDPDDQLFCPTVREDVAFGPLNLGLARAEVERRVAESLAAVGLEGFEDRQPHRLSMGERKRVCLAGVLACEPKLLALDEPTANLDPRARRQLMAILVQLPCAKIIASHDLEMMIDICTRTILVDEGRIHADGATLDVFRDEALLVAHGLEVPASLRAPRL